MNREEIWLDPLYLSDLLSEEEISIRKSAHEFCNSNLLQIIETYNRYW